MQKSAEPKPSLKRAMPPKDHRSTLKARRSVVNVAVCVAALGLFGTACSDSGDEDSKDSKDSAAQESGKTDEDQAVAWRKCMRDNGADIKEPKGDGSQQGIQMTKENQATMQKAFEACKDKAPKNGPGSPMTQEKQDAMVKYAKCMNENGVDMPIPEKGRANALPMPSTDAQKKAHEKASEACKDVRP